MGGEEGREEGAGSGGSKLPCAGCVQASSG